MTQGAERTTDHVLEGIDLRGRRFLVTGASTGLGEETTRAVAAHGAAVTLAVRDLDRGHRAAERIRASVPDADLDVRRLDLASLAGVRRFAEEYRAEHDRLDVLVNNAGVMACPFATTEDGFELQFATNHLGHFLLAALLTPALRAAAPARVVALSSRGHSRSDVDLDDPGFATSEYEPWVAYGRSKTANALFAVAYDHHHVAEGIHAFSVHPGVIATELSRHLTDETLASLAERLPPGQRLHFKTVPQGAATTVWAATAPELDDHGGAYLEDCHVARVTDDAEATDGVRPYAIDPERAEALWARSEQLVGLDPDR